MLWGQVLETKEFQRTDNFFGCGGDSLSATMLLALVEKHFQVALPIRTMFEAESLAELAAAIDQPPPSDGPATRRFTSLVPFRTEGDHPPLFMVHGHSGRALGLGFIAPHLDADQPYYGFVARGMDGRRLPRRTIAAIAADYIAELRDVQPLGPYYLSGFCAGGLVAYEMAQQLHAAGQRVAAVVMVDSAHPKHYAPPPRWLHAARSAKLVARRAGMQLVLAAGRAAPVRLGERIVNETMRREATGYCVKPYAGRVTLIRSEKHHRSTDPYMGWLGVAAGGVDLRLIPGDHDRLLTIANIGPAARELQRCVTEAAAQNAGAQRPALRRSA
jgi:thioesterase domain-containing protein/acyl carrier protein